MTRKKVYLIIQTVLCVLLFVMLSTAAIRIFREGSARRAEHPLESIYTVEAVAEQFKYIAPVLFASVGMAAAGLILGIRDEKEDKGVRDIRTERDLISGRVTGQSMEVNAARAGQRHVRTGGWTAFGICMVPVIVYLLNGAHFQDENLENMFAALLRGTVPWVCAGIACLMIAGILEEKSIRREIEALKAQMKSERASADTSGDIGSKTGGLSGGTMTEGFSGGTMTEALAGSKKDKVSAAAKSAEDAGNRKMVILQSVVIAAAVFFIAAGIWNGSMHDVLIKAINICTECIGLG